MAHIGRELAVARVLRDKTARQVSRETGIHVTAISRIERGRENPTAAQIAALKRATGWTQEISFFVSLVLGPNNGHTHPVEAPQLNQDGVQVASGV